MNVTQYSYTRVLGKENFCLIHVSLVPVLGVVGEQVNNSSFNGNDDFFLPVFYPKLRETNHVALFKSCIMR